MGVQIETRYKLKIGDLFIKTVNRKGIELTNNVIEAFSFVDDFEYSGHERDYYSHEQQILDKMAEINQHGIGNQSIKIVEYKVITEYVNREVEFFKVGEDLLKLRGVMSSVVGHLADEDDSDE